jgi:uncharacterized protein YjbI with pentapeptide repeats
VRGNRRGAIFRGANGRGAIGRGAIVQGANGRGANGEGQSARGNCPATVLIPNNKKNKKKKNNNNKVKSKPLELFELAGKNYFEFLEKFSRRTQSSGNIRATNAMQ